MSTPTPSFSSAPSEAPLNPDLQQAAEAEETAENSSNEEQSVVTSKISSPSNNQMALLRGVTESCAVAVGFLSESLNSTKLSDSYGNPAENLSAKAGINFSSSSGSQSSSDSFKSNNPFNNNSKRDQRESSLQDQLVSSTGKAALSLSTLQQPSPEGPLANKPCSLTVFLPGDQENNNPGQPSGKMSLTPTTFSFTTFSKETRDCKDQGKIKPQEQKDSPVLTAKRDSAPCSPMELFHRSLDENKYASRDSTTDSRKERQDQQQRQQKHSDSQSDQEEDPASSDKKVSKNKIGHTENPKYIKTAKNLSQGDLEESINQSTNITVLPKSIIDFADSEALCSPIAGLRVTRLDILVLCAEIMKLLLKSRHNDSLERIESRKRLMEKAQKMVDSFLYQAKVNKWLSIGSATLGVFGASSPLIGECAGEGVLSILRNVSAKFNDTQSKTFFEGFGKTLTSLSQLMDTSSKIYELKSTADRTLHEQYKDLLRMETEEQTRTIEEIKENWRNMENFLLQVLQAEHEATRSIYQ
ncbi:hypothetical protein [Chlamydiifrater phoenicopteri]|uniref:hypothetical protein n=1 Tax=Chlamydiifrater phoenicopteri TaxID=2681469 RepID=UPI001BCB0266|nr:hypothetical protein [Chlamydiifrater phoenicopteri]